MSCQGNDLWRSVRSGNFPFGKISIGEVSVREESVGELSYNQSTLKKSKCKNSMELKKIQESFLRLGTLINITLLKNVSINHGFAYSEIQ